MWTDDLRSTLNGVKGDRCEIGITIAIVDRSVDVKLTLWLRTQDRRYLLSERLQ